MRSASRRFCGSEADHAGYVNRDPAGRAAGLARRPLVDVAPTSDAAVYLQRIARKLADGEGGAGPR